ncbi:HPP family protein [Chloroflexota bacterium]
MKRIRIIDETFRKSPQNYITQSLLAIVAMALILHFVGFLTRGAVVAALGSSTFVVFVMPNYVTARPRKLIGGHIVGLLSGFICYYVFLTGPLGEIYKNQDSILWIAGAFSVGLSIFLMTITQTEHAPAAGTALGIVAHEWTYQTVIFIVAFVVSLTVIRRLLRGYLRDLV